MRGFTVLALLALGACQSTENSATVQVNATDAVDNVVAPADTAAPSANTMDNTAAPAKVAAYLGKWVGPEGLVMTVAERSEGGVSIDNQWTLDDKGKFEGSVTAEGLRFVRAGEAVTAARTDGDATGMKWLAGKKNCLTVTVGSEAYCQD